MLTISKLMIAENKLKDQFQNYFEFQPFMGQAYAYLDVFFFRLKGDIIHYHYANLGDWKMWISVCVVLLLINHLLLTNAGYWGEYDYIWYSIKLRTGYD